MKLSALQQSYTNRRSNSFRGAGQLDSSMEGAIKSPATLFWLILHGLCCLISLVLGFRFSRLVFFLLFSPNASTTSSFYATTPFLRTTTDIGGLTLPSPYPRVNLDSPANSSVAGSRVVVGRHGILIRPWPHPDPVEVMKAHRIIERVQREQRLQHGIKNPRTLIAVTPTYVRTFQTLHLTSVMHSLMNVPYDVIWIVVEAGGTTNETALLLAKSGLRVIHIGFNQRMPNTWAERHRMEAQMRLHALRVVREEKLDGIVIFADDSNMHSLELFDEIQKVKWIGAVSVGILAHTGNVDGFSSSSSLDQKKENVESMPVPVQGPACNSSDKLVGWHIFNSLPYAGKSATYIDDRATVLPQKLEWAGFVLNSRLLWKDAEDRPEWVKDLDSLGGIGENVESPLSLLKDTTVVEPLGSCGRKVLLWWLRVEARTDSKFPPRWVISHPLEITVPAKRTPWPDAPPELPSNENVISAQEHVEKHSTRTRISRGKRRSRSKRKHETRTVDSEASARHSGQV
ncbi:beta-1,4-xylosyltransferase IRX14-like [Malania oleifera]|uniref:beta-1,4-xylosyltransferase IRX14-like n=1 Tax=Malania oleifera TaxID=397392 RepID=UPI0025AE924F|nr:beta-1,4-xylosyltransferase IRX14-like [Malania oleifera]